MPAATSPKQTSAPVKRRAKLAQLPKGDVAVRPSQDRELFLKAVSAEIRKARERADMTVTDLHRETGISRTVLQGYEAGRFVPGALELKRICQVLKVTPNRIVFGDERPMEQKPLLEAFIGDVNRASGTAKLAIALQVLSSAELSALLSLVESIVITRVGGAKKMAAMFEAVDVMIGSEHTPALMEELGEEFIQSMTPGQKERMGLLVKERLTPKSKKK